LGQIFQENGSFVKKKAASGVLRYEAKSMASDPAPGYAGGLCANGNNARARYTRFSNFVVNDIGGHIPPNGYRKNNSDNSRDPQLPWRWHRAWNLSQSRTSGLIH
jgi:hypothetical protein